MYLGEGFNDLGIAASRFKCEDCGKEFSIAPSVPPSWRGGMRICPDGGCLKPYLGKRERLRIWLLGKAVKIADLARSLDIRRG